MSAAKQRAERIFREAEKAAARDADGSYAYRCGYLEATVRNLCAELAEYADEPCGYRIEVLGLQCTAYLCGGNLDRVSLRGADISDLVRAADEWYTAEAAAQVERELQAERRRDEFMDDQAEAV